MKRWRSEVLHNKLKLTIFLSASTFGIAKTYNLWSRLSRVMSGSLLPIIQDLFWESMWLKWGIIPVMPSTKWEVDDNLRIKSHLWCTFRMKVCFFQTFKKKSFLTPNLICVLPNLWSSKAIQNYLSLRKMSIVCFKIESWAQ